MNIVIIHLVVHECGIAHRDIKPDNILISKDGTLKVVDFGVSEIFSRGQLQMSKSTGSPAFFAPEMCGVSRSIQASCGDVWAMGITLYAMCFGYLPFQEKSLIKLYDSIKDNQFQLLTRPEYPLDADSRLIDLLNRLLEKNPDKRITIEELRVKDI